jgi:hypothetical protein
MHFIGNAALWLQSYEAENEVESWEELCVAIHSKFVKNKHQRHLATLERCKQTGTVEQFYNTFEELHHKVLVHNKHYDKVFFVTKFIKGIHKDIQRAIRRHNSRTVDGAVNLAETQEELLEETKHHFSIRTRTEYRGHHRTPYSGKIFLGYAPEEQPKTEDKQGHKPHWYEKFQVLKAQRKAHGECFHCGDKFQPEHHCNKMVPLCMVEDLMEILQNNSSDSRPDSSTSSGADENLMHIS